MTASPFMKWLDKRRTDDPLGDLAGDVRRDPPLELNAYRLLSHMGHRGACSEAVEVWSEAVERFVNDDVSRRVYFVGAPSVQRVKVGLSADPSERLKALQGASPVELVLLGHGPGGPALETFIHHELRAHRAHGEWFTWRFSVLVAAQHHTGASLGGLCETMGRWV